MENKKKCPFYDEQIELTNKKLFQLQRFSIIQTKLNSQTSNLISDDYAYAWYMEIYPIFDSNEYTELYKDCFFIKEDVVSKILTIADTLWNDKNVLSFYHLLEFIQKKECLIDKYILINVLRYAYIHGCFDQDFWDTILTPEEYPIEASAIVSKMVNYRLY